MKNKKWLIASMVLGMTVTGSAGVFAGANLQKINAYLNQGIGFELNGKAYTPVGENGKKLAPITYENTTYLPVRALANVLDVPVTFDAAKNKVQIGTSPSDRGNTSTGGQAQIKVADVQYSDAQKKTIVQEFAKFESFETAYAPKQMIQGDAFQKVVASDDAVNFLFDHMRVSISPRDDAYSYKGEQVQLANGTQAKWYSPADKTLLLSFKLDDRHVTISSPDQSLGKAKLEKVAVSVAKLSQ